jgi:HdeA/HdeB family
LTKSLAAGVLLVVAGVFPVKAQMVVDVAKVTCKQFVTYEITDARSLSLWLAGYWGGDRKTTVVDVSRFRRQSDALKDYCMSHFDTPLMDAAKTIVDTTK